MVIYLLDHQKLTRKKDPIMTKVLFIFEPRLELKNYLIKGTRHLDNTELIFPTPEQAKSEAFSQVEEARIIIGWRPTVELLKNARQLSLFINPGAGVQHLIPMFEELTSERNIALVNGHGNAYFTAQHGVSLLLSLCNKIVPHHQWLRDGKWRTGDKEAASIPLRDRKVGLLGYGSINRKVHRFLAGFDLDFHVLKADPQFRKDKAGPESEWYGPDQLERFLSIVDTLILAVPLTRRTENLIHLKHLKLLGKDGLLVNIGRGGIINEKDLFTALKEGIITGAAIDVWYEAEPEIDKDGKKYPYHHPFHELENIVLSPHRAASPFSDLKRWDEVIENISRFSRGETGFLNEVDLKREY
jgi:phosphoglycerate dehydrogenase-like enzyme